MDIHVSYMFRPSWSNFLMLFISFSSEPFGINSKLFWGSLTERGSDLLVLISVSLARLSLLFYLHRDHFSSLFTVQIGLIIFNNQKKKNQYTRSISQIITLIAGIAMCTLVRTSSPRSCHLFSRRPWLVFRSPKLWSKSVHRRKIINTFHSHLRWFTIQQTSRKRVWGSWFRKENHAVLSLIYLRFEPSCIWA